MTLDLDDCLDPPYGFGACYERNATVSVHCDAWKTPDEEMTVTIRKVGDRHTIHFPTFTRTTKTGILTSDCDIMVDLYYELADESSPFHITNCNNRHFQGSMQVYDEKMENERIFPAAIDYDLQTGTFIFEPVTNFPLNLSSKTSSNVFEVGILPTTIVIDEEGLMEGEEPEEIPDIDMDYEDDRQDAAFIEPCPDPESPGEEPEFVTRSFVCDATCDVWEGYSATAVVELARSTKSNRGILNIQPVTKNYVENGPGGILSITLSKSDMYSVLFGFVPSGVLGKCRVRTYLKNRTDSTDNFQECEGMIYYYGGAFRIIPNYSYWKYFYVPTTNLGVCEIGIVEQILIEFDIVYEDVYYEDIALNIPVLDVNELPSTLETKKYQLTARNDAWATTTKTVEVVFNKYGSEGEIILPKILSDISKTTSDAATLTISCEREVMDFFGYLPSGKLASCTVHSYCPNHFFCDSCFKTVNGMIYYYKGTLRIVPDVENYHYFYGIAGEDTTYIDSSAVDTGLTEPVTISFTIPESEPSYEEINGGNDPIINLNNVPKVYSTWRRFKSGNGNWNFGSEVTGYIVNETTQWGKFGFIRNEDIGQIVVSPLKGTARVTAIGQPIVISECDEFLSSFFDYMPNGVLGYLNIKAFVYAKTSSGEITSTLTDGLRASLSYYKGEGLFIHIDDENYPKLKTFFGAGNTAIIAEWGVMVEQEPITFTIPSSDPGEYTGNILRYQPQSDVI